MLTKKAKDALKYSVELRMKVASELGCGENAVKMALKRNSKMLMHVKCINAIADYLNIKQSEVYE